MLELNRSDLFKRDVGVVPSRSCGIHDNFSPLFPLLILSCLCLLAAIIVQIILPNRSHNHVLVLQCHKASYFFFGAFLIAKLRDPDPVRRGYYSVARHFFLLSAYTWISVLIYILWTKFRSTQLRLPIRDWTKFVRNSLYAWGVPLLIVGLALILNCTTDSIKLYTGNECLWTCRPDVAFLLLYVCPIGIVQLCTFVLYLLTFRRLRQMADDVILANQKIHTTLLKLYARLLIVVGLLPFVSLIVCSASHRPPGQEKWYVLYSSLALPIQGILLFVIYVVHPSVLRDLRRLRCYCGSE